MKGFDKDQFDPEFDAKVYLDVSFYKFSKEGKFLYTLSSEEAEVLLNKLSFSVNNAQKRSVRFLEKKTKGTGTFPSSPKKPIRINLQTHRIEDGVSRLLTLLSQRGYRIIWLEFVL